MRSKLIKTNHAYKRWVSLAGFSLIDLVISIGIIVLLFGGIFLAYTAIADTTKYNSVRTAAAAILAEQAEIIRNMPYADVGTVNGIPLGVIPATQTVTRGDSIFTVNTTVRNIDDPFDGTLGGTPNDTTPADYKLVELEAICVRCVRAITYKITTNVAPNALESASVNGTLLINVLNASGQAVPNADVHVVNTNVSPSIDLTDTTNSSGVLRLVGVPTSTQQYQITVTKSDFSSEKTYSPGTPTPVKPHATVVAGTATEVSFAIDSLSGLNVRTSGPTCSVSGNRSFSITGSKLIGTNPNTLKFSTTSQTDAGGIKNLTGLEWDTYTLALNTSSIDLMGTIPLSPFTLNPSSTNEFRFVTQAQNPRSLMVTVKDIGSGAGVASATVTLSKSGYSGTFTTSRRTQTDTTWAGGQYSSKSGVETDSTPGSLLMVQDGGVYSTTTTAWLISNTIDVGTSSAAYFALTWNPSSQPIQTGADSARFQVASNNDNTTWNFIGPDGTASTYYSSPGTTISSDHASRRYIRYKVFLKTQSEVFTPEITDVGVTFNSACVPMAQVLFSGLDAGTYTVDVSAPGYSQATTSLSISANWQETEMLLSP